MPLTAPSPAPPVEPAGPPDPQLIAVREALRAPPSWLARVGGGLWGRPDDPVTQFIVAHRMSTVRGADRILVLEQGVIVEESSHGDLLQHRGAYHRLVSNQLELVG